jgi:transcription antitermination factor NusG
MLITKSQQFDYWQVIYTMPKFEKKVYAELNKKGVTAFLPIVSKIAFWSDRRKKLLSPLFPNYIFVKIRSSFDKQIIYKTKGFVRFLTTLGKPDEIPGKEIELIKSLLSVSPIVANSAFEVGEKVEVINGHFKGIRGTLLKKNGNYKLSVHLTAIKQDLVIEISPSDVIKLSPNKGLQPMRGLPGSNVGISQAILA